MVDKEGCLTGSQLVYIYPDGKTILKGKFNDGQLVEAYPADYRGHGDADNPYSYVVTDRQRMFRTDSPSATCISLYPLLSDPYEDYRVEVKKSRIEGAGEGLYAKIDTQRGEIMSFYNGIRITHEEVDERDWKLNNNTISLDDDTVIDVPIELSDTSVYCGSLSHKANHSFNPNCKFDYYQHIRFGFIRCIRTIKNVKAGEELTVGYNFEGTSFPDWYIRLKEDFTNKNEN
jgi:histone-lysine N-methyltransferase SETD7